MKYLQRLFIVRMLIAATLFAVAPFVSISQCMAQKYISDVAVAGGGNAQEWLKKNGYEVIDKDLNKGARGWYIYLGYKKTDNPAEAITGMFVAYDANSPKIYNNCTYNLAPRNSSDFNGDMNRGHSGSKDLFLFYTKGKPEVNGLMTSISVEWFDNSQNSTDYVSKYKDGELSPNADMNEGAGGKYIYFNVKYYKGKFVKINFNSNGGSGTMSPYAFVDKGNLPSEKFSRKDYIFDKWNTQSDGNGKSFVDQVEVKGDDFEQNYPTLYAIWQKAKAVNKNTGKSYADLQAAINDANAKDEITVMEDLESEITIDKPLNFNLNGHTLSKVSLVNTIQDAVLVQNGTIMDFATNRSDNSIVKLSNVKVLKDLLSFNNHIIIESGEYFNIVCNRVDGKIDVYGIKTFVKALNDSQETYPGITIYGGYYVEDPSKSKNVTVDANCSVSNSTEIPGYYYMVNHGLADIPSFVKTANDDGKPVNYFSLNSLATENTEVQICVKLNSIKKGINAIFGSASSGGTAALSRNDVFGVWVDASDNSFHFATGCKELQSPAGIAKPDNTYYITLKNGHIVIDSIPNAKEGQDYYHHDFAVYPFHANSVNMEVGKIGSLSEDCIADMNICFVKVWEKGNLIKDIVPVYRNKDSKDAICLYEKHSASDIKPRNSEWFEGQVASCKNDQHYGYFFNKSNNRECIICGKTFNYNADDEPYIDFNGTSYFDTGYVPNNKTEIRMHFIHQEAKVRSVQNFFGISYDNPQSEFALDDRTDRITVCYPQPVGTEKGNSNLREAYGYGLTPSNEYYLKMSMKNLVISRNSDYSENLVDYSYSSSNYQPDSTLTLLVGAVHLTSTATGLGDCLSNYKLFSYEIYESGKLLHKFLPSTKCGVYGFFDTIDSVFHAMKGKDAKAPFEIEDKEGSISTQQKYYFQSDVRINNNTKIEMRFRIDGYDATNVSGNHLFGCYDNSKQISASIKEVPNQSGKYTLFLHGKNNITYTLPRHLEKGEIYSLTVSRDDKNIYIKLCDVVGNILSDYKTEANKNNQWDISNDLYIFNDTKQESLWCGNMTFYKMDIYDGNNLVRRYLPIKKTVDGNMSPCLFDVIYGKTLQPIKRQSSVSYDESMVHIVPCKEHKYGVLFKINDDKTRQFKCAICDEEYTDNRNYIAVDDKIFNTGITPDINTNVRVGFNTNDLENKSFNYLFGQANNSEDGLTADGSYYLELSKDKDKKQYNYKWTDSDDGYASRGHVDEYISFKKNELYVYKSPEMKASVYHSTRPNIKEYTGKTTISFSNVNNGNLDYSWASFPFHYYFLDIYQGDDCVRKYVPAKKDNRLGFLDLVHCKYIYSESENLIGYVKKCEEHKYCDIVQKDGKWQKLCWVCDEYVPLTDEELAEGFIRTNGTSRFVNADKTITLGTIDYETNTDVKNTPVYNSEGKLIHNYFPSHFEGKVRMYDAVTGTFEEFEGQVQSYYIPECQYHKYYKLEKNSDGKYRKHCCICDVVTDPLNALSVKSADDLKAVQPENKKHIIYIDMEKDSKPVQHIDAKYPDLNESSLIYEYAIMQEGALRHYFMPAYFNKSAGIYDVVANEYVPVKNATVQIDKNKCAHKYYMETFENGKVMKHCYICDHKEGIGYYTDVKFEKDESVKGHMGIQRIVVSDTLKPCTFTKPLSIFSGWREKKADGTFGELISDGATMTVPENHPDTTVLVAQWTDAFTCNGDTLAINDENTSAINIVDDGINGFASANAFQGKSFSYSRTLTPGTMYGTICLPFAIKADEHPDFDLYVAKNVTNKENDNSFINLQQVDAVEAGIPCIFKMKEASDTLYITHEGSDIVPVEASVNISEGLTLNGSFTKVNIDIKDVSEATIYAIQGDTFFRITSSLSVRPYHAYIMSNPTSTEAPERYFLNFGDDATGIAIMDDGKLQDLNGAEFYTPSGVRLNAPQNGINIVKFKNGTTRKIRK
ncbi:MAG: InlB B-repeat-containing protein [Prevotellaceae bacterium]|nr:InlB B-repeat-containing protein [Candidatus Minthosoma equi]